MHAPRSTPTAPLRIGRASGLLVALVLAALGWAWASPTTAQIQDRSKLVAGLDSAAQAHAADSTVAGVSVAVSRRGEMLLHEGYGLADLELDVPMPKGAVFEVASITKQFTAAAILQLAAKDSLDLDAPITEYLSDYNTRGHRVTVRHLLHHTSGIPDLYGVVPRPIAFAKKKMPRDSVFALVQQEPFRFAPGTAMSYSSSGYFLLGFIIESVSGESYGDYLQEHLLAPAGMKDSKYCGNEQALIKKGAKGYSWSEEKGLRKAPHADNSWAYATGGLCSTAADLVRWTEALHSGRVLPDSMYEEMIRPGRLADGTQLRYAMGLRHRQPGGYATLQHSGATPGFLSHLRYYPEEELTITVLQNSWRSKSPIILADSLARLTLGEDEKPQASTYEGDLSPLAGRYVGPASVFTGVLDLQIRAENGRLVALEPGGKEETELTYRSGLTWTHDTERIEERYTFVRKGNEIIELRLDRFHGHLVLRRVGEN